MNFLWTESYRPHNFKELDFHHQTNQYLENLSSDISMPNIIFYGPNGAGKYTWILCMLYNLYGNSVLHIQNDKYRVKHNYKDIEISIRYSKNHIEINPSEANN